MGRIPQDGDAGDPHDGFLEELQPFRGEVLGHVGQARDIAVGLGEAGDKASPNGIKVHRHDNRDRACRVLGRPGHRRPRRHDDVHREPDQLGHSLTESFEAPLRKPVVDDESVPLHIAQRMEALPEGLGAGRRPKGEGEIPDPRELRWRLGSGHQGRGNEPENQEDDDNVPVSHTPFFTAPPSLSGRRSTQETSTWGHYNTMCQEEAERWR